MIPLISSDCVGPLGVGQLPRTWWKATLKTAGLLDDEYPECSGGLDQAVLNLLGLDRDETLDHIHSERPSYLAFERWVRARVGDRLDPEAIARWNAHLVSREHTRPEKIEETYRDIGLPRDAGISNAGMLNRLQDWQLFHVRDLNGDFAALGGRVVPTISSLDFGPLGVCQLPRTWLKLVLHAKGKLHPDYPHMTENGFDPRALRLLGIEPMDAVTFTEERVPSYLQFEAWILDRTGGKIDRERVEEWNAFLRTRERNPQRFADISTFVGWTDADGDPSAAVLNHVEDWHYAYRDVSDGFSGRR